MNLIRCSTRAMVLCPDRKLCCNLKYPGVFAPNSECHRFNEEIEKTTCDSEKTTSQQLEVIAEKICDEYCRFPRECSCEDELDEHCLKCPINYFMVNKHET